jgi:hypothetical protein
MKHKSMPLLVMIALALATGSARGDELLRLEKPALYDLQVAGFELSRGGTVTVDAVGRGDRDGYREWGWVKDMVGQWGDEDDEEEMLDVYAWILDAETREPVWVMLGGDTDRHERSRTLREIRDEVDLDPGRYELYFYSGHGWLANLEEDRSGKSRKEYRRMNRELDDVVDDLEACYVSLSSNEIGKSDLRSVDVTGDLPDALIRMNRLGDGELRKAGFTLSKSTSVRVYAHTEYQLGSHNAADFGWIVDADSGKRVWDMSDRRGRRAGGGRKNRLIDRDVRLDAGRYILYFGTDDSHSYEQFNVNPPYDPLNWGVTLLPGRDFDAAAFSTFDPPDRGRPLIDFSRARDGDYYEQAFRLARDADVEIYGLGEAEDDGWYFYDYGWIADAKTGETVWEMDDRNSYPAGGAEKNRLVDETVHMPAGTYVAYYVTDDSHSYEDWNDAAPFDPEAWGMRIYPSGTTSSGDFELVDRATVDAQSGALARIVRVGDNAHERERFTLDEDTEVEIYALGEGSGGDMYDYGYIRDRDSRRIVWEMDYRDTEHAGGASKNRMVRTRITLPAGDYEVVYETDGSHSFEGWNARRPDDPSSWGITVRKVD